MRSTKQPGDVTPPRTSNTVPPIVRDVLTSPGAALDPATRSFMEPRFGYDFGNVRVHADAQAAASARAVNAVAYAAGEHVVLDAAQVPAKGEQAALLAHELAHVIQQDSAGAFDASTLRVDSPGSAAEVDADRAAAAVTMGRSYSVGATAPVQINRKISKPATPVRFGTMAIEDRGLNAARRKDISITFSPDPNGPKTEAIDLIQLARVTFDSGSKWTDFHKDQKAIDNFTLPSGYHIDARPDQLAKPRKHGEPNISPAYPPSGMLPGAGVVAPTPGFNRAAQQHDAQMTDTPGGGPMSGRFEFETVARSRDLGIDYGSIQWSFRYEGPGMPSPYSGENSTISSGVSDQVQPAVVAFNKYYRNRHVVRASETLQSIALDYYGKAGMASEILRLNAAALGQIAETAALTPGVELEMPGRGWEHLKTFEGTKT